MLSKNKVLIIAICLAAVSFVGLLKVEKKLVNPNGVSRVYVCNKNINKNTLINEKNIDSLFKLKTMNKNYILSGSIQDKKDLIGKKVRTDLYKEEVIIKNRIIDSEELNKKIKVKDPVNYGVKFEDIADVVGGQVSSGDILDLFTDTNKFENLYVDSVVVDGKKQKENETIKNNSNISVVLCVSRKDVEELDKAIRNSKIKSAKILKCENEKNK